MKILMTLLALLFLSSCSSLSIGYRFADWAIEDRADDLLDLTSKQEKQLKKDLDQYFLWHRKEMIPRYVVYLKGIQEIVASQNYEDVEWEKLNVELDKIYYDTMMPFKKILSTIFVDMSQEQVLHLEKEMAGDNKEKEKEYGRPHAERASEKVEDNVSSFEDWFGSVSLEQKMKIQQATQDLKFPVNAWFKKRKSQQQELLALLRNEGSTSAQFESFLNAYIQRVPKKDTRLYYSEMDRFIAGFRTIFLDLLKTVDEKQRKHFQKRMQKIISQLKKIHEKGKSS